ncbi:MAG: class I SAM-dependent methyltransferase [Candidatus Methanomethylophilaceae archaeon]|nr:class I SAM-dependent methyltransferase [Candidatus Methanomethylophilaceae archaeon]
MINNFVSVDKRNYDISKMQDVKLLMSPTDIKFLIYMLKTKKPKKMLEIGVCNGGSSYYLLKESDPKAVLHSVDIEKDCPHDPTKPTGYTVEENLDKSLWEKRWFRHFGMDVIDCIEEIGGGIDFVLIDTVHTMPGEFLSYLAIIPYLKQGAIVVLHDVFDNYHEIMKDKMLTMWTADSFCTGLLMSAVPSPKKYMPDDQPVPNIGAFEQTGKDLDYVIDVLRALYVRWKYIPDFMLHRYLVMIRKKYGQKAADLFEQCYAMQFEIKDGKYLDKE